MNAPIITEPKRELRAIPFNRALGDVDLVFYRAALRRAVSRASVRNCKQQVRLALILEPGSSIKRRWVIQDVR